MSQHAKKVAWTLFKLGVVVAIFAWLLNRGAIDWTYFHVGWESLPWAGVGALLILASILMTGTRYWVILGANNIHLKLSYVLKTELAATFFNICSIGPVGGDIVRTYYVYKNSRDALTVGASTLADRLFGVYALLFIAVGSFLALGQAQTASPVLDTIRTLVFGLGGAGLGFGATSLLCRVGSARFRLGCLAVLTIGVAGGSAVFSLTGAAQKAWWILDACLAIGGLVALFLDGKRVESGLELLAGRGKFSGYAARIIRALLVVKTHPASAIKAFCLSMMQQACYILAVFSFSRALLLPAFPSLGEIFFATSLTFTLSVLPMPGSGLGISEAAMEFLLVTVSPGLVGGASVFLCFRAWLILVSATGLPFYFSGSIGHSRPEKTD